MSYLGSGQVVKSCRTRGISGLEEEDLYPEGCHYDDGGPDYVDGIRYLGHKIRMKDCRGDGEDWLRDVYHIQMVNENETVDNEWAMSAYCTDRQLQVGHVMNYRHTGSGYGSAADLLYFLHCLGLLLSKLEELSPIDLVEHLERGVIEEIGLGESGLEEGEHFEAVG